jgi:hypothetical protein
MQTLAFQAIPQWSDFSVNHPENVVLEVQALLGGMIASVINERARQLTYALITDRLAMIRKARPAGYTLSGATAAQVDGTFYLPNGLLATRQITLPVGTRLRVGSVQFQTVAENTIDVGNNASTTMTVENAEGHTDQFSSDEQPNQVLQLSLQDVIEDSLGDAGHIYITAGDGQYKDRLDASAAGLKSFHEAGPDDRVFLPLLDNNGRAFLFFGNGINGKIPQGTISVEYKVGGGEDGRVAANAVWAVQDAVYDDIGNAVTVLFQNPADSTGGYNATTVDEARSRAPLAVRTLERCVNEEDFEFAAGLISGIARAAMITSNQDTSVPEDAGYLYLVAYGSPYTDSGYYPPATPTAAQMSGVRALIDAATGGYPQLMGVATTVYAASFTDITVAVKIYKESGYSAAQVKANITTALQKFFAVADDQRRANTSVDFGYKLLDADGEPDYKISWSHVMKAINNAEGVREVSHVTDNLLLNLARQSVILGPSRWPRLSSITVYDMDDSGAQI